MNPELEGYQDQLLSIRQSVPGVTRGLSDQQFNWRPAPNRWSIAECFGHLNATSRAYVPAIDAAIDDARRRGLTGSGPFAYPLLERLFLRSMEPPPRMRFRAPRAFAPPLEPPKALASVVDEFAGWQDTLGDRIRRADGLDLRRARRRSPAFPLISWSLGTIFAVVLAHERRHIWQAKEVRNAPGFPTEQP